MTSLLLAVSGLVLLVSAYYDIRYRVLPDTASIILIVLAVIRWSWHAEWVDLGWSFACALGLFVVSAAAFAMGWVGGGDVKLASATSFFLGVESFASFMLVMSIAGGGLSLIVLGRLLADRMTKKRMAPSDGTAATTYTVPYGAAIALAGLYILYVQFRSGVN